MKANNPQPQVPLLAFFETVYWPLALCGRSTGYVEHFRAAIRWLAATIGREPRVGDLNRDTMRQFVERLATAGLAELTMKNYRKKIWALWRYANELGYAEAPPAAVRVSAVPKYCRHSNGLAYVRIGGKRHYLGRYDAPTSRAKYLAILSQSTDKAAATMQMPPASGPPKRAWLASPPPAESLLGFYRQVFRPVVAAQLSTRRVNEFDAAINALHDHVGRPLPLVDVSPELVEQYRAWLDTRPLLPKQRIRYRGCICRIMRAAGFEHLFPKRDGAEPRRYVAAERPPTVRGKQGWKRRPLPVGEPGTLLHFFEHVYVPQAIPNCTHGHRNSLYTAFRHLRECFGRDLEMRELSREKIAELIAWLKEGGAEQLTAKNIVARLLAVWRYAAELDQAPTVPRFRKWRVPRNAPDAWSLDEMARIYVAAGELDRKPIAGIPAARFMRAMLLVGYWTALRRGTLLRIRISDVDLSGWLHVPGSQIKNGRGKRYRLGADAVEAIRDILEPGRELLFPSPSDAGTLSKHLRSIIADAGVPPSRHTLGLWHKVRRTAITHTAARAGMPAAIALAGHSAQYVTERYLDPSFLPDHDATAWLPSLSELAKRQGVAGRPQRDTPPVLAQAKAEGLGEPAAGATQRR